MRKKIISNIIHNLDMLDSVTLEAINNVIDYIAKEQKNDRKRKDHEDARSFR